MGISKSLSLLYHLSLKLPAANIKPRGKKSFLLLPTSLQLLRSERNSLRSSHGQRDPHTSPGFGTGLEPRDGHIAVPSPHRAPGPCHEQPSVPAAPAQAPGAAMRATGPHSGSAHSRVLPLCRPTPLLRATQLQLPQPRESSPTAGEVSNQVEPTWL